MPASFALHSLVALTILLFSSSRTAAEPNPEGIEFFEKKIRPVLVEHCYACHSVEAQKQGKLKGGLLLDSRDAMRSGGDSGPAIEPGDVGGSLLIDALKYESFEMPPSGQLPEPVIADFVRWVEMQAPDPRDATPASANVAPEKSPLDLEMGRKHWAFQAPRPQPRPHVQNPEWVRQPMDAFILKKLEEAGVTPSPMADRRMLVRRVSFDLTGLPPTPAEVRSFLNDPSPDAYERLVERLLSSPRYGERWARLWLDLARYAEDQAHIVGSNKELFYPNAYLYRDWVIAALNADMPYDEFIRRQLAADLMDATDDGDLVALGFLGLGPKYYRRGSLEVMADEWEDRVDVVSRGLLGLTVACARCHDHKFDPIATKDYYALAGVFASTEMFNRPLHKDVETVKNGQAKAPTEALHIVRDAKVQDLNVFIRGNVKSKGDVVPRRFLEVLSDGPPPPFKTGSGRLELADAIASRDNPLTARVIVNRVWRQHFGRGLVSTPSNFGHLGEPPTHPELLDDLAVRFMENGWSLKSLHREIVLSATYRQSGRGTRVEGQGTKKSESGPQPSPPNPQLYASMPQRRLSVEGWRDAVLSVAGRLTETVGGESIDPQDPDKTARTIYARISRLQLNPMLSLFDFPDPNAHSERRAETTTPLQKLFVLNHPFMVRQSNALAERICGEGGDNIAERIQFAYELLYSREATKQEVALGTAFLAGDESRWPQYAQVLLASNEMLFVD